MGMKATLVSICLACLGTLLPLAAQTTDATVSSSVNSSAASTPAGTTTVQVPPLIRLGGTLPLPTIAAGAGTTINVTFSLYAEETGGTPLWQESQNVELDATGRYAVLLGSTQADGLPVELFTSGQAQWLGVRPAEEAEQPRIMLVSVPFALKAGDAQTLGGKPASAYVTAPPADANPGIYAGATGQGAVLSKPAGASASTPNISAHPAATTTGSGTADYVPLWTSTTNLGNSRIYENTTKGYIGIGTTAPVSTFNVQVSSSATASAIEASTASPATWGVWGANSATSDTYGGVYGTSASDSGIGVEGLNSDTTGKGTGGIGVFGQTSSPNGFGVYGKATDTADANYGVYGLSAGDDGYGVFGTSTSSIGGYGVFGSSTTTTGEGYGVYGLSASPDGIAVFGVNSATTGYAYGVEGKTSSHAQYATAVFGEAVATTGEVYGVSGQTDSTAQYSTGVNGYAAAGAGQAVGVQGESEGTSGGAAGVYGYEFGGTGEVYGVAGSAVSDGEYSAGVYGYELNSTASEVYGVEGYTASNGEYASAVYGFEGSTSGIVYGVDGDTNSTSGAAAGVLGYEGAESGEVNGVLGGTASTSTGAAGVFGYDSATSGGGAGVIGTVESPSGVGGLFSNDGDSGNVVAGLKKDTEVFSINNSGDADFSGTVSCSGCGSDIDDPADAANKYLFHSAVESPDMMNVYNGNITTNANGVATVVLPNYFEALNRDFRYQLTVIGQFAQAFVAQEISHNQFTIKTSQPNVKVSWQVTGIRQDPWANAHRIPAERDKPADKRGYYLHPELYGAGPDKNIHSGLFKDAKTRIPSPPQLHPMTQPTPKAPPVKPAMRSPLPPQARPTPASVMSQR
jgi:trimeric autotransporter adhesin